MGSSFRLIRGRAVVPALITEKTGLIFKFAPLRGLWISIILSPGVHVDKIATPDAQSQNLIHDIDSRKELAIRALLTG
jgi:hypothetical protein